MKTFGERVNSFLKSLGGGEPKGKEEETEENENPDLDQAGDGGGTDDDQLQKSELVEATDIFNALISELKEVNKSLSVLTKPSGWD